MIALAWRNLWRQGWRSLVTLGAVAVVVFISLFFFGFVEAVRNSLYQDITERLGHLQVHPAGWRDARDLRDRLLRDADTVRAQVEATAAELDVPAVVVGSLQVQALIAGSDRARGVAIIGQDWPELLLEPFVADKLREGSFVTADDVTGIALDQGLAAALQVGVGDEVVVYAPATEGDGAAVYTVVGLLDLQGNSLAYVSLAAAQALAAPGAVSALEVHLPELHSLTQDGRATALAASLRQRLATPESSRDGVVVETWREVEPGVAGYLNAMTPMLSVINAIFFALAGLLVLNTIYLSLLERVPELGLILSLGAAGRTVMGMIALESLLLVLLGAAVGAALGVGTVASLSGGFSFPGIDPELFTSLGLDPVLYPALQPWQLLFTLAFAVITALLAALWPARLAASIEPVEAMRFTA